MLLFYICGYLPASFTNNFNPLHYFCKVFFGKFSMFLTFLVITFIVWWLMMSFVVHLSIKWIPQVEMLSLQSRQKLPFVIFELLLYFCFWRGRTHLSWRCQLSNQSQNEAISWKFFFWWNFLRSRPESSNSSGNFLFFIQPHNNELIWRRHST